TGGGPWSGKTGGIDPGDQGFDVTVAEMQCDDAADCPAGQRCCVQATAMQGSYQLSYQCSSTSCDLYESCIPGGVCARGFVCLEQEAELTGAKCVSAGVSVPCGGEVCS